MTVSYRGHALIHVRPRGQRWRSVVRFLIVNAIGYGINVAILAVFVICPGFSSLLVQLAAIVLVACFIFVSMRFWVFADDEPDWPVSQEAPLRWGR